MSKNNAISWDDLSYYDTKLKKHIDTKLSEVSSQIPNTYTKDEIDKKLTAATDGAIATIDEKINKISENVAVLLDDNTENSAAILVLQNDDKSIQSDIADLRVLVENKIDESAMAYLATKNDLENLATREYVKDQIREAQLEAGDIDLSDYAKKSDLDNIADSIINQNAAISKRLDDQTAALSAVHNEIDNVQNNLEQYITESELAARNYATLDKLESYATKDYVREAISNIPEVDLSNYATKSELEAVQNVAGSNSVKLFAIESDLFDIEKKLETIPSIEGLASEQFVLDKISEIDIPEVPTKVSELENDTGYITEIPSEYVTETELEQKGYLTEHQSLENYATKEFVENSIESINIPDTSEFITMKDVEAKGYATEQYVLDHVNTQIETEVETQVTEVVEKQVTEVVQTQVKDEVTEQLAKNEKINYGTFGEV